jgi:hypothetical protein
MPLTREQTKYQSINETVFLPTVAIDNNLGVRGNVTVNGSATFGSIIRTGGTSSQFLMADGSVTTGGSGGGTTTNILTLGSGLTGTSFNGSAAVTATVNSSVIPYLANSNTFTTSQIITPATSVTGLTINAATSSIGLIVKANATTPGNIQEWQTSTPTTVASISATGAFTAVTKSFDIEHPTKPEMRLRYGSLEGPENGVYVRGKSKEKNLLLPDYWTGLVDEDTITVNLTAIGNGNIYVKDIIDNTVLVDGTAEEFFFTIYGERKDVDKLIVEY